MAKDYEIFEGKTLSDVFKDIYDNSKTNKQQLEVLMKEVVGFIKDGDTEGRRYSRSDSSYAKRIFRNQCKERRTTC